MSPRRARPLRVRTVVVRQVVPRNGIASPGKYVELLRFRQKSNTAPIPASFML
jgi:hypothetical protein